MSDPYAGTVTVRNILNHVISPKIVSDGLGGYRTSVDLVNVDTLYANTVRVSDAQCGVAVWSSGVSVTVAHEDVAATSIVFASITQDVGAAYITSVTPSNGSFTIRFGEVPSAYPVNVAWFIAKF